MELRPLGTTGINVSPIGLGTVKLGRTEGVKYPEAFELPDDNACRELLSLARDLGINLLDTAPAYGQSEERLGGLIQNQRDEWVLCTKCGENFEPGVGSTFDFTPEATLSSVERSLMRLQTDHLDIVLIHSDGRDHEILNEEGALDALRELKHRGLIRAIGISTKTPEGGSQAVEVCDVVMLTYSLRAQSDLPAIRRASEIKTGVLIKKALDSGHLGEASAADALRHVLREPGVSSIVVGTINPDHIKSNVRAASVS